MSETDLEKGLEALQSRAGLMECLDGMFKMVEAIRKHRLTIYDLEMGVKYAVDGGHKGAAICCTMMSMALEVNAKDED